MRAIEYDREGSALLAGGGLAGPDLGQAAAAQADGRRWRLPAGRLAAVAAVFVVGVGASALAGAAGGVHDSGGAVVSHLGGLVQEFSTSTSYCYEETAGPLGDCWADKPGPTTPNCTVDSGSTVCQCAQPTSDGPPACHIDGLAGEPPATGRCASKTVYIAQGEVHTNSDGAKDVTGDSADTYCSDMVLNDEWEAKHLVKLDSDPEPTLDYGYWFCWPWVGGTWHDGACRRRVRYLTETCWDGWFGAGTCEGSDASYDEYATSCYKGQCTPFAWAEEREQCQCAWVGWNLIFACSALGDQCGGHACVLSTGDGNKYCDYATGQNW